MLTALNDTIMHNHPPESNGNFNLELVRETSWLVTFINLLHTQEKTDCRTGLNMYQSPPFFHSL